MSNSSEFNVNSAFKNEDEFLKYLADKYSVNKKEIKKPKFVKVTRNKSA